MSGDIPSFETIDSAGRVASRPDYLAMAQASASRAGVQSRQLRNRMEALGLAPDDPAVMSLAALVTAEAAAYRASIDLKGSVSEVSGRLEGSAQNAGVAIINTARKAGDILAQEAGAAAEAHRRGAEAMLRLVVRLETVERELAQKHGRLGMAIGAAGLAVGSLLGAAALWMFG